MTATTNDDHNTHIRHNDLLTRIFHSSYFRLAETVFCYASTFSIYTSDVLSTYRCLCVPFVYSQSKESSLFFWNIFKWPPRIFHNVRVSVRAEQMSTHLVWSNDFFRFVHMIYKESQNIWHITAKAHIKNVWEWSNRLAKNRLRMVFLFAFDAWCTHHINISFVNSQFVICHFSAFGQHVFTFNRIPVNRICSELTTFFAPATSWFNLRFNWIEPWNMVANNLSRECRFWYW